MRLSPIEAKLFFDLMLSLQFYVNDKLKLLSGFDTVEEYTKLTDSDDKAKVNEALFANKHLFDNFIDENPFNFSMADLFHVSKWKKCIEGTFYIERYLKNYAIFISEDDKVYQVTALSNSFDEIFPKYMLPQRVKTRLLPFQDKIIYDGLLTTYKLFFGSGITNNLKRIYMKAKHNEKIIASLDENENLAPAKKKDRKDWKPEIQEMLAKARKMRSDAGQNELLSPAFSLVKASLELAELSTVEKTDSDQILKLLNRISRECGKAQDLIYYMED